ncbi:MAG: DUF2231 domain-containing protein [Janthinobacterium lividum]
MHSATHDSIISVNPRLGLANQPVYAMLVQFPAVCFVGALLTDLAYWRSAMFIWATFSIWLLAAGCIVAVLAALAGLVTWISHPHVRALRWAGWHVLASLAALALSVLNAFVHSRDGYTAVMPTGLTLSAIVVILMIVAMWLGWPRTELMRRVQTATIVRNPTVSEKL